ncbi:hypothetical protein [Nocardioides ferulae]|uniref:hypothetical protein n=1 Tax=Nocardioides ferulae TaxID=2340821 RepID=UPI000EAFB7EA|nr:hypothetical protein [Nocardioides ferulae]
MVLGLVVIGVAVVLTYGVTTVGDRGRRARQRARRARWVERHPEQVNSHDIRVLLSRELLPDQVDLICARAESLRIAPLTMLMWIRRFDVATLALVVAADLSHRELLAHLGNGTTPDLAQLEVLACLNGLDQPEPELRVPAPGRVRLQGGDGPGVRRRMSSMPRIYDPGWPFPNVESTSSTLDATWRAASGPDIPPDLPFSGGDEPLAA